MPHATADDGVKLYYEETGSGTPVIFVHEFAGDLRSWEPQVRHFGQRYRAIAYNARGYPPSDVPEQRASYGQARAADDILAVLDHPTAFTQSTCGGDHALIPLSIFWVWGMCWLFEKARLVILAMSVARLWEPG